MPRFLLLLATIATTACGGSAVSSSEPVTPKSDPSHRSETVTVNGDLVALPKSESFGALIAALNKTPEKDELASCLLEAGADFRIRAATARAIRPLPPAPEDLNGRFEATVDPVRLLTLWGQLGVEADRLVAVTFTTVSAWKERPPLAVLTDQGIIVRSQRGEAGNPLALATALDRIRELAPQNLVVTAERDVTLGDLYTWLERLASLELSVSLAVMLPENTRVPEATPQLSDALRCGQTGETFGEIDIASVQHGIAQVQSSLAGCIERERGPGARGGKVQVRLQVAPTGKIDKACIVDGALGSDASERCTLETLQSLTFAPPTPEGERVTLVLPLTLQPKALAPVRIFCAPQP